jgi:UDP-N-acetylmuramate--alanine ligase
MSHTYTRTAALLEEFANCFSCADILFFHKIYSSAREQYEGGVNGKTLFEKVKALRASTSGDSLSETTVFYTDEPLDAAGGLKKILRPGDLFITMGAGSNWPLGLALYDHFRGAV